MTDTRPGHDHGHRDHPVDHESHHAGDHGHGSRDSDHSRDQGDPGHEHRRGWRGAVSNGLHPHSHDATDSIDSALEASADGMRTLKISLVALAGTAALQAGIVVASGSVALLADTIHNAADALTAVPLAAAFWLGRRPANHRYTHGYGRSEDLAGIVIVFMIAASSVLAGWVAIDRLVHPHHVRHIGWVIVAGIIGCVGNEAVAVYRIRSGRRIGSAALEADGYHARADGLTSLAVVIGAIAVAVGLPLADPVAGLVITLAILVVVRNAGRNIYRRLMDAVDPALVDEVMSTLAGVDGVDDVESVRLRWVGHELHAEAEIVSDGRLSLAEAHDVAERAYHLLLHRVRRLARVTIHTNPSGRDGADPHALTAHHHLPTAPELPGHRDDTHT